MNIYVGNLEYQVKEDQLKDLFSQFGEVASANIIKDKMTGRSKGFGFVDMPNDLEAAEAIKSLNGHELGSRAITAMEARPKS